MKTNRPEGATTQPTPAVAEAMTWERIVVPGRGDIIGVRTLKSGQREFLMHNEALCHPYYVANEGATTQPTPASEPRPLTKAEKDSLQPFTETRNADIALHYGSFHETKLALKSQIEICNDLRERLRQAEQSPAQPVPSAGSKPQEEGGTLEDALIEAIAALRSSYNVQDFPADGDTRQDHAANALEAILHRRLTPSQPVADGGGLPPTIENLKDCIEALNEENQKLREHLASSQEALRVARESALRLIPAIKHIQGLGNDEEISGEIMLALENLLKSVYRLSPEGSSR